MKIQNVTEKKEKLSSKKDLALKNMSKYLLSGAEMLRESCPKCDVPYLKNKSDNIIFCGSCGNKASNFKEVDKNIPEVKKSELNNEILDNLNSILYGKLEFISNNISSQTSEKLKFDLELIDEILNLIIKISKLNLL